MSALTRRDAIAAGTAVVAGGFAGVAVSSKTPKSTTASRRSLVRSRHDAFTPCQVM